MRLDPQVIALIASSAAVGLLMALSGVQKSALDWKRSDRICPSCGRQIRNRTCGCTAD